MRIRQFGIQRLEERKWGKKIVERGSVGRWHRGAVHILMKLRASVSSQCEMLINVRVDD